MENQLNYNLKVSFTTPDTFFPVSPNLPPRPRVLRQQHSSIPGVAPKPSGELFPVGGAPSGSCLVLFARSNSTCTCFPQVFRAQQLDERAHADPSGPPTERGNGGNYFGHPPNTQPWPYLFPSPNSLSSHIQSRRRPSQSSHIQSRRRPHPASLPPATLRRHCRTAPMAKPPAPGAA
jgi:hypothetical protein